LLNKAGGGDGNDSDGSEDFEEPPDQRAILHVLSNLPGISATDSRSYRIEALRVHLENQLGDQAFINAYRHLVVSVFFARRIFIHPSIYPDLKLTLVSFLFF